MRVKQHTKHVLYMAAGVFIILFLYALKNTSYFFRASAFIVSFVVFFLADTFFKLKFRNRHYLILIFIATTGILFSPLYLIYSNYDKVLHLLSPILFSILIFYLVSKINGISFFTKLVLTFSVTVCCLAMWELIEFSLDYLYNFKLQGVWLRDVTGMEKISLVMDRNDDTMADLLLGVVGSLIFAIGKTIGDYYNKFKNKKKN